ncbi:hypothetical protein JCM10295v2_007137 [Rhodotorula toruloides]
MLSYTVFSLDVGGGCLRRASTAPLASRASSWAAPSPSNVDFNITTSATGLEDCLRRSSSQQAHSDTVAGSSASNLDSTTYRAGVVGIGQLIPAVEKTQAKTVDKFNSPEPGYIGGFLSDKVFYYSTAAQPMFKQTFDLNNLSALRNVAIPFGYQGADFELLNATITDGAMGFVLAGTGAASIPAAALHDLAAAAAKGVSLVRATKINVGAVVSGDAGYNFKIAGGLLNPVKSRRLLQILLALNSTNDVIRNAFEGNLS